MCCPDITAISRKSRGPQRFHILETMLGSKKQGQSADVKTDHKSPMAYLARPADLLLARKTCSQPHQVNDLAPFHGAPRTVNRMPDPSG